MSGKVDILIVGRILIDGRPPETSKKYQDAEKLNKKILREAEFEDLIRSNKSFTLNGKPPKVTASV